MADLRFKPKSLSAQAIVDPLVETCSARQEREDTSHPDEAFNPLQIFRLTSSGFSLFIVVMLCKIGVDTELVNAEPLLLEEVHG